ncbi:hypothetical protein [Treponema sp.]|uniref:hypothetical protein n=1 Tax=Treponema sp. TaxID=166 RepID=UPI00388E8BEB
MKFKVFFILSIFSIFFASCSLADRSCENQGISFSIPSGVLSNSRALLTSSTQIKITATIEGSSSYYNSQSYSTTYADFLSQSPVITFTGLRTSETYSIKVDIYSVTDGEQTLLYTGSQSEIKLSSSGATRISLKMADKAVASSVILYNKRAEDDPNLDETHYALYKFDRNFLSSSSDSEPEETYSAGNAFTDFIVDSESNVYYTDGTTIYKNGEATAGTNSLYISDVKLYKEKNSGLLFYGGSMESDFYIAAYDEENQIHSQVFQASNISNYLDGTVSVSNYFDFAVYLEENAETNDENDDLTTVTRNGCIFLSAGCTYSESELNHIVFIKVPVTYTETTESNEKTSQISLSESIASGLKTVLVYQAAPLFAETLSDNAEITDMTVQNGNLYALLREVNIQEAFYDSEADPPFTHYSRGAIVKINLSTFTTCELYADSSITKNTTFKTKIDEYNSTHNVYQPSSTGCLFGPQKFIAIKPKKLIIADNGFFFYKDNDDDETKFSYKNINKAVIFDEDSKETREYEIKSSLPVFFDSEEQTDEIKFYWGGSPYDESPLGYCKNRD